MHLFSVDENRSSYPFFISVAFMTLPLYNFKLHYI